MSYVNKSLQKKDAMALVTGKPVYTDDLAPKDCLIIKILRSPYANAWVEEIKTDTAMKVEGMALILTWKDVPKRRFASLAVIVLTRTISYTSRMPCPFMYGIK